ncbi:MULTISPECIES: VasL domain-containing protein [Yersinia pseudotuberculosis complex]|uniref:VasL domain-containing protein n=1 Tax=Yersinia pseudotuberculosis complex TaxID=1649845 RepID=UPI0008FFD3E7|nr:MULTISPECIES: VasL domain-containing protein [Yersinia pseudotuberculosis complex]
MNAADSSYFQLQQRLHALSEKLLEQERSRGSLIISYLKTAVYPSYFKPHVRWPPSLTPVTYLCKLPGIYSVAAFLQLELFWVYTRCRPN